MGLGVLGDGVSGWSVDLRMFGDSIRVQVLYFWGLLLLVSWRQAWFSPRTLSSALVVYGSADISSHRVVWFAFPDCFLRQVRIGTGSELPETFCFIGLAQACVNVGQASVS